jgi:aminopeptidase N
VCFVLSAAYLASLEDPEYTELALHEYRTATNMTEQFAALAAIAQNPGKTRDDALADFYSKWQHDFLVIFLLNCSQFAKMNFLGLSELCIVCFISLCLSLPLS